MSAISDLIIYLFLLSVSSVLLSVLCVLFCRSLKIKQLFKLRY